MCRLSHMRKRRWWVAFCTLRGVFGYGECVAREIRHSGLKEVVMDRDTHNHEHQKNNDRNKESY